MAPFASPRPLGYAAAWPTACGGRVLNANRHVVLFYTSFRTGSRRETLTGLHCPTDGNQLTPPVCVDGDDDNALPSRKCIRVHGRVKYKLVRNSSAFWRIGPFETAVETSFCLDIIDRNSPGDLLGRFYGSLSLLFVSRLSLRVNCWLIFSFLTTKRGLKTDSTTSSTFVYRIFGHRIDHSTINDHRANSFYDQGWL